MAARLSQRAVPRQSLGLTPALQQSVKLLELPNLALAEILADVLAENPLLEWAEGAPAREPARFRPVRPATAPRPLPANLARLFAAGRRRGPTQSQGMPAAIAAPGPTLRDHLLRQLGADIADASDRAVGQALIDSLDEAGYLRSDALEVAQRFDASAVDRVLARLQQFDPPGVFARSLSECLALQLADRGRLDAPMRRLLDNLELLAAGEAGELARRCGVSGAELDAMIARLRRLDPRPGLAFDAQTAPGVVPDLSIERAAGGGWQVELNGETMPRLVLNAAYPQPPASDREGRRYVGERRAEARWLLRAVERRGETLLRIAHEIVARQSDFLDGGAGALKPLSRREIAERLELHESTVSRASANKYAATPRGVIALADFFARRVGDQKDDSGHAPGAVRQRLRALIAGEAPGAPLSDERLANLLRAEGVSLARRTVAKYREMLRIPAAAGRRRRGSLVIHKTRPKIK